MISDLKDSEKKLVNILDKIGADEGQNISEIQVKYLYVNQIVCYFQSPRSIQVI